VALKIPLVGLNGERDNSPLLREVRSVSALRHPNIVAPKNADIIEGHAVLATELCTNTLDDCSRPMSAQRLFFIMRQVLKGLAHAHRNRIVHCDVTPGNIFLFPNKRAALGDFGISVRLKGRPKTIEDFGTPGYVAPEQAYGYPTCRSDCFSVGLILYEYLTGVLPRWPFDWPPRGLKRLRDKTNVAFVRFMKQSLTVDPKKRFDNAGHMLEAMMEALPRRYKHKLGTLSVARSLRDWHLVRRETFLRRYGHLCPEWFDCAECGEPIAESMHVCPWCGSERNRFDECTSFAYVCPNCLRGLQPEWPYCPWCYGPKLEVSREPPHHKPVYHTRCRYCRGKLMRFMRYCPWCHRKVKQPWYVQPLPEICGRCHWAVDSEYWHYCPWCAWRLHG
jgi:serine/threonine-protein kinase